MRRREASTDAARRVSLAAAILAFSVLADSALEHYRGSFQNRAMYAPPAVAALTLAASLAGLGDDRAKRHPVRDTIFAIAAATGVAGLGFHAYNILKRPGRLSWQNLFYAAPAGAPAALTLAGLLGRDAETTREAGRRFGFPSPLRWRARRLAAISAVGIAGSVGEAGLLHFRGAFQNPAMLLPVSVPPAAAALLASAAARPTPAGKRVAKWALALTTLLGLGGVGFHAFGIARSMGGWRNWRQNVMSGPPLPAPPSFTGLALAGLAALELLGEG